jgi:4-hydroxybutyrate CoA-transferase
LKIGIKYCGGCNPRYDRVLFVEELQREFKDFDFETANTEQVYDALIVVGGCKSCCADHKRYQSDSRIFVTDKSDYTNVRNIIEKLKTI